MLKKIIRILWCMHAITCVAMDDHHSQSPNFEPECSTSRSAFQPIKAFSHCATFTGRQVKRVIPIKHIHRAAHINLPIPLPVPVIPLPQQLLNALVARNFARAQELLDLGFDAHIGDDFAIKSVIKARRWEAVRWLIEHGIDIHFHDDAIIKAVLDKTVKWKMVLWLLDHGIDVHYNDNYIMRRALAQHNSTIALKLAARGADINTSDGSMLIRAFKIGNFEKAYELMNTYHVQVETENIAETLGALIGARKKSSDEKITMLAFLVDHGLKCDDILQFTRFSHYNGNPMFEWLIAHGGNIHVANGILMRRALDEMTSSYNHFGDAVLALIDHGFDIHFDHDTPMKRAIEMQNVLLIYGLIKRGIDIHFDHDAPMHIAQEKNDQEFVRWLQNRVTQK